MAPDKHRCGIATRRSLPGMAAFSNTPCVASWEHQRQDCKRAVVGAGNRRRPQRSLSGGRMRLTHRGPMQRGLWRNPAGRWAGIALMGLGGWGVAALALAQMDLSGEWGQKMHQDAPERGGGPDIGDYTGMPINAADRMRADTWSSSKWEQPEHECEPHPADYAPRGPGSMRVW